MMVKDIPDAKHNIIEAEAVGILDVPEHITNTSLEGTGAKPKLLKHFGKVYCFQ